MDSSTQLQTLVDASEACYVASDGGMYRFYYKTDTTCIDIKVCLNDAGVCVMLREIGKFAAAKILSWDEAAAITQWVRRSYLGMVTMRNNKLL